MAAATRAGVCWLAACAVAASAWTVRTPAADSLHGWSLRLSMTARHGTTGRPPWHLAVSLRGALVCEMRSGWNASLWLAPWAPSMSCEREARVARQSVAVFASALRRGLLVGRSTEPDGRSRPADRSGDSAVRLFVGGCCVRRRECVVLYEIDGDTYFYGLVNLTWHASHWRSGPTESPAERLFHDWLHNFTAASRGPLTQLDVFGRRWAEIDRLGTRLSAREPPRVETRYDEATGVYNCSVWSSGPWRVYADWVEFDGWWKPQDAARDGRWTVGADGRGRGWSSFRPQNDSSAFRWICLVSGAGGVWNVSVPYTRGYPPGIDPAASPSPTPGEGDPQLEVGTHLVSDDLSVEEANLETSPTAELSRARPRSRSFGDDALEGAPETPRLRASTTSSWGGWTRALSWRLPLLALEKAALFWVAGRLGNEARRRPDPNPDPDPDRRGRRDTDRRSRPPPVPPRRPSILSRPSPGLPLRPPARRRPTLSRWSWVDPPTPPPVPPRRPTRPARATCPFWPTRG